MDYNEKFKNQIKQIYIYIYEVSVLINKLGTWVYFIQFVTIDVTFIEHIFSDTNHVQSCTRDPNVPYPTTGFRKTALDWYFEIPFPRTPSQYT